MRMTPLTALALGSTAAALALTAGPSTAAPSTTTSSTGATTAATATTRLQAVGLEAGGKHLVRFRTDRPGGSTRTGTVTGLKGDSRLLGIDYRVADGKLYGLGNNGGIYTLTRAGLATRTGALTVPLEGTLFGVDVNPAADALRIVSNTGQNLRQSFATPAVPTAVDTRLTTPPTTGDTAGVVAAAYTNNDTSTATATTLYDIDVRTNRVAVQAPANAGTLSPTGSLGVDARGNAGLDIYSVVRNGKAVDHVAYATLRVGGVHGLYRVDLLTGEATRVGAFAQEVVDLAIPVAQ